MATITDFCCYFNGRKLPTDAFGNNAAFDCPNCGHPVIMLTHDDKQRGMSEQNPSQCKKCVGKYWLLLFNFDVKEIHLTSSHD